MPRASLKTSAETLMMANDLLKDCNEAIKDDNEYVYVDGKRDLLVRDVLCVLSNIGVKNAKR